MTTRAAIASGVLLAAACAMGIASAWASRRWEAQVGDVADRLARASAVRVAAFSQRELEGLPAPVQRYLRAAISKDLPVVTHARVESWGTFNMGKAPENSWKRFTASQDFFPGAPGFVWNARIRMAPGVNVFVRDAFVDREGSMLASAFGLVPVVNARGTPELAEGALMRYLAEAVWFPTALLPSEGVSWTPLSDSAARATIAAGPVTAALDFTFTPEGLVATAGGMRDNDSLHAKYRWEGVYSNWIERDGMRIPTTAEVAWYLPTGKFAYWRGTVAPAYDFADAIAP